MESRRQQKKREKKKHARLQKQKRARQGLFGDTIIVATPPGGEKMSAVLLEFLEPYSEQWRNEEEFRKLVNLAVAAWNAALFPDSERDKAIQEIVDTVPPEIRADLREILEGMIQRKITHFGGNKRAIINYEVTMRNAGPHLSVVSTLDRV